MANEARFLIEMEAAGTTLEYCDEVISQAATREDIERVVDRTPRASEDWFLTLTRPDDDYMDVTVNDDGTFQVQVDANNRLRHSAGVVDEALLKSLLTSFLEGDDSWSREGTWIDKPVPASSSSTGLPKQAWAGIAMGIVVIALYFLRMKEWIVVLFAAAIPGAVAYAIVSKMREVKRASTWTKGSAHVVRSEQVSEERKQADGSMKAMTLAAIEYEYSAGFNKFRSNRVSIGEVTPNSPQVQEYLKRYPVGTGTFVYYDPKNPQDAVLERDLPKGFAAVWVFVAVLAVACVGGALWFTGILK